MNLDPTSGRSRVQLLLSLQLWLLQPPLCSEAGRPGDSIICPHFLIPTLPERDWCGLICQTWPNKCPTMKRGRGTVCWTEQLCSRWNQVCQGHWCHLRQNRVGSAPQPLSPSAPQPLTPLVPHLLIPSTPQSLTPSAPLLFTPFVPHPLKRSSAQRPELLVLTHALHRGEINAITM